MEEKDLKKLKRSELLEIMLAQSEEIDRLRAELKAKDEELESRRIAVERSGSIAEASLQLTKVFQEAQKAADLYLDNVRGTVGTAPAGSAPARPAATTPAARRTAAVPRVDPEATTQIPRHRTKSAVSAQSPSVLDAPATVPAATPTGTSASAPAHGRHFGRHAR